MIDSIILAVLANVSLLVIAWCYHISKTLLNMNSNQSKILCTQIRILQKLNKGKLKERTAGKLNEQVLEKVEE